MTTVYVRGRQARLQPSMVIGKGGEADIYRLDASTALKFYKRPTDPDYTGDTNAQQGAAIRIKEQQTKLPAFPSALPVEVVTPTELAYDASQKSIVGYTMPFIDKMDVLMRLSDRQYRETGGIDGNQVVDVFRKLHAVVASLHAKGVVIGDFNDLNVLTDRSDVRIIDADSMQYGGFHCHTFTNRFVDPLRCDPSMLQLARPHNEMSDWYAYFIMLLQSLLYVGPYGGVHRPKTGKRLQHDPRVLQRLTVLDPSVIYPKPAQSLQSLPDELLDYMKAVFEEDVREAYPTRLLDMLRWTTCLTCGLSHARSRCPGCARPGAVKEAVAIRGTVMANRLFKTDGRLLHVANQNGTLHYLYYENGAFYREGGRKLLTGNLAPGLRFRIQGSTTVIGRDEALISIAEDGASQRHTTDRYRTNLPVFDANARATFWVTNGQLVKSDRLGPSYIGDVLSGQTMFWVGASFGFGFYQAGQFVRSFIFDTQTRGLNDQVAISSLPGQLVDATCVFSEDRAWFLTALQNQSQLVYRCYVIDRSGTVLAQTEVQPGDDSWLSHGIRGHLAVGASLYVATDEGIVRVGIDNGQVARERKFPDTEQFVDAHTQLVLGQGGIYAVSPKEITQLTIR